MTHFALVANKKALKVVNPVENIYPRVIVEYPSGENYMLVPDSGELGLFRSHGLFTIHTSALLLNIIIKKFPVSQGLLQRPLT